MLVAGAGVVGTACARALQQDGYRVCLADPDTPGSGCSSGNAGIIATDHVMPLASLGTLKRLPALLRDARGPLYLKASRLPGLLPWFVRLARACPPAQVRQGAEAIAALTGRSLPAWQRTLAAAGAGHLLQSRGLYAVYQSDGAFERDGAERRLARELGVAWQALSGDELREREPALAPDLRRGIFYPDVAHVLDPLAVVTALLRAYREQGGALLTAPLTRLDSEPHQVVATVGEERLACRYVVVAAGLASSDICRTLGYRPPLAAELGYHVTFPDEQHRLSAPVAAAERGFIVTPMADHLRAAGTVEFARRQTPPSWHRARILAEHARALFAPALQEPASRWQGARPTLPDYLPAIGALPGAPRVLAAFGHQHMGLTTAAITAEIIRDLVRGAAPAVDPSPYLPHRFGRSH